MAEARVLTIPLHLMDIDGSGAGQCVSLTVLVDVSTRTVLAEIVEGADEQDNGY